MSQEGAAEFWRIDSNAIRRNFEIGKKAYVAVDSRAKSGGLLIRERTETRIRRSPAYCGKLGAFFEMNSKVTLETVQ
jgi:hypothetical protein